MPDLIRYLILFVEIPGQARHDGGKENNFFEYKLNMKYPLILIIKFYQYFISPWLGKNCKYSPTCSAYCLEAINSYGAIKGMFFSIKRIIRCNPFTSGGYDPVEQHVERNK